MDTKALRQKILDLAVRGKLVPQDPADEPAFRLLARIREEKEKLVKEGRLKAKDIKGDTVIYVGADGQYYEKYADGSETCIEKEIPFKLPEGWAWERLSNIASFSGGKTPSTSHKEYWGKDVSWVTSKDMKSKYIVSSQLMLSEEGASFMQKYPENTLLMVTRSGILRHTLPVAILRAEATINQDLKAISLYDSSLAEYIYCCLKGMEQYILLKYKKSGTTVENINFDEFKRMLLPIPPIEEQKRITAKIAELLSLIEEIESGRTELLSAIRQAGAKILDLAVRGRLAAQDLADEPASRLLARIREEKEKLVKEGKCKRDKKESVILRGEDGSYYEKIGSTVKNIDKEIPFDLPEGWTWCRLKSLAAPEENSFVDGPFGSNLKTEHYTLNREVRIIQLNNIGEFEWKNKGVKYTTFEHANKLNRCATYPGDIVIAKMMPAGRAIIVPDIEKKYVISSDCVRLQPSAMINSEYLVYMVNSPGINACILDKVQGIGRTRTSLSKLKELLVPLPPVEEQKRIVIAIERLFSSLAAIEDALS